MIIEGCIYLLQEKETVELTGSIVGWVEGSGEGIVKLNILDEMENIKVYTSDHKMVIKLSFDNAFLIAGWILCIVNQNKAFRKNENLETPNISSSLFYSCSSVDSDLIELAFELPNNQIQVCWVEEQSEIEISDVVAEKVALAIYERMGEWSARTANSLLRQI